MFCLFFHRCKDFKILYRQALPLYLAAEFHLLLYVSLPGHTAEQLYDHHQFPAELLERQKKTLKHDKRSNSSSGILNVRVFFLLFERQTLIVAFVFY